MFGKSKRVLMIICKDYRKQLDTATLWNIMDHVFKGHNYDLRTVFKSPDNHDGTTECWQYLEYYADDSTHKFVKTYIANWIYKLEAKEINDIDVIDFE